MLLLTPAEHTRFTQFPTSVTAGWKVSVENLTFNDSPQQMLQRRSIVSFEGETLRSFMAEYGESTDEKELARAVAALDLDGLSEHDVTEFMFLLGPTMLSIVIDALFDAVKAPQDIEQIATISDMRHVLLQSFPTGVSDPLSA